MEQYCLYLRKSRSDIEAEAHGEGETLARHEKALLELAKRMKLNVTEIYREVVSGDTIAQRPVVQELLQAVEQGVWAGVLVMEVERLARGDTVDQGIVAQTFKYSETKIITPIKTYDPTDEYDEEYFEFGLFMARREYKTINRRLQRGRLASIKEGKYVGNEAPFGYKKVKLKGEKGFSLEPVPEEADIIKMIFQLYVEGEEQPDGSIKRMGTALISRRLNDLGYKPRKADFWVLATIRDIIRNPVYAGFVRWNWKKQEKKMIDGKLTITRHRTSEPLVVKGRHTALITKEMFDKAQEIMSKNPPRPVGEKNEVRNSLAGLMICGMCGRKMVRRPYNRDYPPSLICAVPECKNVSSKFDLVERRVLEGLREWLDAYKLQWKLGQPTKQPVSQVEAKRKSIEKLRAELAKLEKQLEKTHDLLEQGIYDTDTFLQRSRLLAGQISETKEKISQAEADLKIEKQRDVSAKSIVPKVEKLLELYDELPTPQAKNDMLKEVLEKVVYVKEKAARYGGKEDGFELTLYPKIPNTPDTENQ